MLATRFIVISRARGDTASIQAIQNPLDEEFGNPGPVFNEITAAVEAIERDLLEWRMGTRKAARWAKGLTGCRIGFVHHADEVDRYYRILKATLTSNRVPIVPGLRVRDYDQRKGEVTRGQFMADSPMAPGGHYHDGWYYVEADGNAKTYLGTKLVAL